MSASNVSRARRGRGASRKPVPFDLKCHEISGGASPGARAGFLFLKTPSYEYTLETVQERAQYIGCPRHPPPQ